MKSTRTLLAAALASLTLSAGAQNLVVNGSFEADIVAPGTWVIQQNFVGWTGNPDIEIRNAFDGIAQDGVNYVELDTFANSSMSQAINATGLVQLTFWYGARPSASAGSNTLSFSLGNLSGTLLENAAGSGGIEWLMYTGIANLGNSGTATLTFTALGTSDQLGGSIDNVSVTAVPEPANAAMMIAGLGLIGGIARWRKARGRSCLPTDTGWDTSDSEAPSPPLFALSARSDECFGFPSPGGRRNGTPNPPSRYRSCRSCADRTGGHRTQHSP